MGQYWFHVSWEIEILDEATPADAAEEALKWLRIPGIHTFMVTDRNGHITEIDWEDTP